MVANVKMSPLGSDGPVPPIEGLPNTDTSSGHGTHVAGDVAGRGTASNGAYKGSAPGASLVGIGTGEGLTVHSRGVLQSYDWILDNQQKYGIRVINNSFGGSFEPFDPKEPINRATKAAADAGIVVLFAQGNDGDEMTMNSSATAPWVIAVAAATQKAGMTDFSSGGLDADVVDPLTFDVNDLAGDPRRPLRMGLYHPSIMALGEYVVGARAAATILPVLGCPPRRRPPRRRPGPLHDHVGHVDGLARGGRHRRPDPRGQPGAAAGRRQAGPPDHGQARSPACRSSARATATPTRPGRWRWPAGSPGSRRTRSTAILDEQQAARDAEILAGLPHPLRTTAWSKDADRQRRQLAGSRRRRRCRDGRPQAHRRGGGGPAQGRSTPGSSLPFVADPAPRRSSSATPPAGRSAAPQPRLPGGSGTTVLDLDLTKLTGLAWGTWTVEVSEAGPACPSGSSGRTRSPWPPRSPTPQAPDPVSSILPSAAGAAGPDNRGKASRRGEPR